MSSSAWDRSRPVELGRAPRDRPVEGQIQLERAGPVAKAFQRPTIARGQPLAGDRQQLARGHVEQRHSMRRKFGDRVDAMSGLDRAAQRDQLGGQGLRHSTGTAGRQRPAVRVGASEHHERSRRAHGLREPDLGVSRRSGEQGPGPLAVEAPRDGRRRAQPEQAEPGHGDGTRRR